MKTEKVETMTTRANNQEQCDRCKKPVAFLVHVDGKGFHAYCADMKHKEDLLRANNNQGEE